MTLLLLSATVLASIPGAFDQLAQGNIVTRVGVSGEEEAIFLPLAPGLAEGNLCAGKRCVVGCSGVPVGLREQMALVSDSQLATVSCAASSSGRQASTWHHMNVLGTLGCQPGPVYVTLIGIPQCTDCPLHLARADCSFISSLWWKLCLVLEPVDASA